MYHPILSFIRLHSLRIDFISAQVDFAMLELYRLNDDIILYLLGLMLLPADEDHRVALAPLSSTCRWLRSLSKPIIFSTVHFTVGIAPPTPEFYLPSSLWSYIQ